MKHSLLALPILLTTIAPAQTFVVSSAGGAGVSFTSIATAVAAVPDGAVLQILAGNYQPFHVQGKSLKLLAQAGTTVASATGVPAIAVSGLQPGQSVVLQGLRVAQGLPLGSIAVSFTDNQGPVLLDAPVIASGALGSFTVTGCSALSVRNLQLPNGSIYWTLTDSRVVFENCRLGSGEVAVGGTQSAVRQFGGSLQLVDCVATPGLPLSGPVNAVEMHGGELRVLGASQLNGFPICVGGTGSVRYASSVTFPSGTPFGPTIAAAQLQMPTMRAHLSTGTVTATLFGPAGDIGVIAVGLVGVPAQVPGIADPLWLDPNATFLLAAGVFGAGSPLVSTLSWAGSPIPAVRAVWQGASLDSSGALQLSNPSVTILP